jgi:hypothetical protein
MLGIAIAGLVISGAIVAFLARPPSQHAVAPAPNQRTDTTYPAQPLPPAKTDAVAAIVTDEVAPPAPEDATVVPADLPTARHTPRKDVARAPAGPISTKQEAEQILRPELLACMKEHQVHYLITRLGNKPDGGTVPPLGLTLTSVVDFKPTPGFASTPLGRCLARAASAVRAPAYGGNYIYFGLRQDSVPDPLADAAARLDAAAAKKTLSVLDDEARDCGTRSPAGSRPGESVRIMVSFHGATGQ